MTVPNRKKELIDKREISGCCSVSAKRFVLERKEIDRQQKRAKELTIRFGLRRVEDIAMAMRIAPDEARKLCRLIANEEENNG